MTQEHWQALAENPKEFLSRCKHHNTQIEIKQKEIERYHGLALSITQEIKEVTTFSLTPSHKVENACLEAVALEAEILEEIRQIHKDRALIMEAIGVLPDKTQRVLLEARYLSGLTWEEISVMLPCSYRWALRLHGLALQKLSEIGHVNSHSLCDIM